MRHLRALAEAGLTTVHLLPCNDIATIEEDRSRQLDPGPLDHLPPDSDEQQRRVGEVRDARRLQLGLRPAALPRAGGLLRRRGPHARVPGDGRARSTASACASCSTSSSTTRRGDSRLDQLVPGYYHRLTPDGRDRRLDLLREHRDRAPDDGEADARRARALGARVPRRRLPLRPHGPPHEGQPAGGARAARAGAAPLRRGLELRRGRRRRAVRRRLPAQHGRHRDRHVQRRPARRRPRRRAARRGPDGPGLGHRRPVGAGAGAARARRPAPARRLRGAARRRDRLRRRARQRDAVRRARAQAPARRRAWTTACA